MGFSDMSTAGKVGVIAGVCCIGLIVLLLIVGLASPDVTTTSSSSSSSNVNVTNDSDNSTSEKVDGWQVKIITNDSWNGAVGGDSSQSSYDGKGNKTIDLGSDANIVSVSIQKKGSNSKELKVQIFKDGELKEESSTTASYGVVTATASKY